MKDIYSLRGGPIDEAVILPIKYRYPVIKFMTPNRSLDKRISFIGTVCIQSSSHRENKTGI